MAVSPLFSDRWGSTVPSNPNKTKDLRPEGKKVGGGTPPCYFFFPSASFEPEGFPRSASGMVRISAVQGWSPTRS
jgi:hypothetical protein